jgi:hypothetical protein
VVGKVRPRRLRSETKYLETAKWAIPLVPVLARRVWRCSERHSASFMALYRAAEVSLSLRQILPCQSSLPPGKPSVFGLQAHRKFHVPPRYTFFHLASYLVAMKVSNQSSVPVYTISGSNTARPLPEWLIRKRKRSLKKDPEFANRIELLQDFEFEEASQCLRVSEDGEWVMSTGM